MRENRALLREAGFSVKDADRLKNASDKTISDLLESKRVPEVRGTGGRKNETRTPEPKAPEVRKPEPAKIETPAKMEKPFRHGGKHESREDRNRRLRETRQLLLDAGLSKEDALRLRNVSPETLKQILETGKAPEKRHHYLREKKEHTFSELSWREAKVSYTSRYNVIVELLFVRPGPQYRRDYVTIQSDFEVSREDAMTAVRDIVAQRAEEPKEGSDWQFVDARIVGCFINRDIPERPRPKTWTKYKD